METSTPRFAVLSSVALALFAARATAAVQDGEVEAPPRFVITTVAGTGQLGFSGDGGPAIEAKIQRPTAVAVDSRGNLYIADEANLRVRRVDPQGVITTVVGSGSSEPQDYDEMALETNLQSAYGVAVDHEDFLYVLNRGHSEILRVDEEGVAFRVAGTGVPGFSGDGGPAVEARVQSPNHLVADAEGNLFVADTGNHRIRKIDTEGIITTVAGTGTPGFSGDGGPAVEAQIAAPAAIGMDREGNVWIPDHINGVVRKLTRVRD